MEREKAILEVVNKRIENILRIYKHTEMSSYLNEYIDKMRKLYIDNEALFDKIDNAMLVAPHYHMMKRMLWKLRILEDAIEKRFEEKKFRPNDGIIHYYNIDCIKMIEFVLEETSDRVAFSCNI
jgi:hypothetical protein